MLETLTQSLTMITLICAAYSDVKSRRIPNNLTFSVMGIGLLLAGFPFRAEAYIRIAGWLVLYMVGRARLMGMGDLKLCMAILCMRGIHDTWVMFVSGLLIMTCYCFITDRENTIYAFKNVYNMIFYHGKLVIQSTKQYPFAVFLALGYLCTFLIR